MGGETINSVAGKASLEDATMVVTQQNEVPASIRALHELKDKGIDNHKFSKSTSPAPTSAIMGGHLQNFWLVWQPEGTSNLCSKYVDRRHKTNVLGKNACPVLP